MSKYIVQWNDKALMRQLEEHIVAGLEAACDFAAARAQSYAAVRTGLMRRETAPIMVARGDISARIEARGQGITGYVGVRKRKGGAFYAYFVELGTRKMAARPFLRPAVFGHAREIVRMVARGGR